jgi:hypothetical protein
MKSVRFTSLALALVTVASNAATLSVTSTADSGAGSLRAQVAAAAGGDTVQIVATGRIALTSGEILINGRNLTIAGSGANNLVVTTNSTTRALRIVNAQCTISGITFDRCTALPGDIDTGGAVAVDNFTAGGWTNVTTIDNCAFSNNQSGWGGAVDIFQGGLIMTRCTFSANACTGMAFGTKGGGGALSIGPTLPSTITNCTFSGNSQNGAVASQPGGGAIYNYGAVPANPPSITVEHCTFLGNTDASGAAGAIRGNFTASYQTRANLRNCLLVNNQAPTAALRNFAGNSAGLLTGSYASLGGNVTDEDATSSQFMAAGEDKVNNSAVAATVSPVLALNGGTTGTHSLSRGSPAQRTGTTSSISIDQRGAPRHGTADAGAYELIEPDLAVTVSNTRLENNDTITFGPARFDTPATMTVTLTNMQTSPFTSGPLSLGGLVLPAGFTAAGFPATPLANGEAVSFDITLLSSKPGFQNATLTFTGNDAFTPELGTGSPASPNLHTFQLSALVTDTADHWRQEHFGRGATNSGLAADDANPAGDGITNLIKYTLGLDPQQAYLPGSGLIAELDPAGFLRMAVNKNPAAADVSLAIEVTGDITASDSWSSAETTVEENSATLLKARDNVSITSGQNRFIRLKVARP